MTNGAAIGYMVIAAKEMALDSKTIHELESLMYQAMDYYEEADAERCYQNS